MVSAASVRVHEGGVLAGARVAFTGRLASMCRREAWAAVRRAGGVAVTTVSRRTDLLVVGQGALPIRGDGSVSELLVRGEELQRRGGRLRIVPEARFLELLGRGGDGGSDGGEKAYDASSAAAAVGVDEATLRRWEHLGLVRSREGRCSFRDIVSLQTLTSLLRAGVSVDTIARSLSGLSRVLPEAEHPLAQLRLISADRGTLLAQVGGALVDPGGQHHFGFVAGEGADAAEDQGRAASVGEHERAERIGEASADVWFDRALTAELNEDFEGACELYRRLLSIAPHWGEAYFNMGNCLRMQGRVEAAEEMYKLALVHDPEWESAWYNLADVQEMSGRYGDAVESLLRAVQVAPSLADAHFNLAHCLDAMGRHDEAQVYWRHYLKLDTSGVWAEAARARLGEGVPGVD